MKVLMQCFKHCGVRVGRVSEGRERLTSTAATRLSPASPMLARASPNMSEKVIMPRMFMFTAASAMLSGNMFRVTPSSAERGETGSSPNPSSTRPPSWKEEPSDPPFSILVRDGPPPHLQPVLSLVLRTRGPASFAGYHIQQEL